MQVSSARRPRGALLVVGVLVALGALALAAWALLALGAAASRQAEVAAKYAEADVLYAGAEKNPQRL